MKKKIFSLVAILSATIPLRAELALAPLFRDRAVIQRDKEVPIWGRAEPGENISVSFKGQTQQTKADEAGKWEVKLAAMPASADPTELVVTGKNIVTVRDVLVGEVWFCSGQSNMAFHVSKTANGEEAARKADFPLIRAYAVPRLVSEVPLDTSAGEWRVASPETVPTMSAVAFFFARDLQKRLQVPVGVITSSWGGTFIESWIPPDQMKLSKLGTVVTGRWEKNLADYPQLKVQYDAELAKWNASKKKAEKEGRVFTKKGPPEPSPRGHEDTPGGLFNGMVNPFTPYAIRGFLWYQGESNVGVGRAGEYEELLKTLIAGWRKAFGQGDISFLWVQLPKYGFPVKRDWAQLREAQAAALALPSTGQVVTVDLPLDDPKNKHPQDKQTVGSRLGLLAAVKVYGVKGEFSGPRYKKLVKDGVAMRLSFTHADGLRSSGDLSKGFEVAGEDQKFYPAQAKIEGDEVIVQAAEVPHPVAVRYAFNNSPEANLYNGANLPAEPFRSDDWPLLVLP